MNNDFVCLTELDGNARVPVIINTRFIRTIKAVTPKNGQCPHYNAGARTYLLMEYNTIEESIVYVAEELMHVAKIISPLGGPQ
ncbi:hypothetical protein [Achromobacter phage shaaii_LB5]|nr:hypothetical protein [Achromobacter phage shaaii_LB5]